MEQLGKDIWLILNIQVMLKLKNLKVLLKWKIIESFVLG